MFVLENCIFCIADLEICIDMFSWDDQVRICERMIKILEATKGSVVFGRQYGNVKGREEKNSRRVGARIWRHDADSFQQMWDQVGKETVTSWETLVELYDLSEGQQTWTADGTKTLKFEVERVA